MKVSHLHLQLYMQGPCQRTWHRNDQYVDEQGHATDLIAREAVRRKLFNLAADPNEMTHLANRHSDRVEQLAILLREQRAMDILEPPLNPNP